MVLIKGKGETMYGVTPQAYDRAITVFSPDGRLFQVEYAKEAVKRGATSIGIIYKEGVLLVAHKSSYSKLIVPSSVKKIFDIDDHISISASGLIADARRLVDNARLIAQKHKFTYDEEATPEQVAKSICETMQIYTQYGGIRPFGVSLLVAGMAGEEPQLFEAEPSGAMTGYYAVSIGNGKKEADAILEKEYKQNMSFKDALKLGVKIIKDLNGDLTEENIEVKYIHKGLKRFESLPKAEIKKLL